MKRRQLPDIRIKRTALGFACPVCGQAWVHGTYADRCLRHCIRKRCALTVGDGFVMCGEGGSYCGELCEAWGRRSLWRRLVQAIRGW